MKRKLGEILIGKGLITQKQLEEALEEQKRTNEFLGAILLRENEIKEKDLLTVLSEQFNISFISLKDKYFDWDVVKTCSPNLILSHNCFPFKREDYCVTIAVTNPLDIEAIRKAEEEFKGLKLKLALVSRDDMKEAVRRYQEHMQADIFKQFE